MRVSSVRYLVVLLTIVGLAGCTSTGSWSFPNPMDKLAFWKSHDPAPSDPMTDPMRPSQLAMAPSSNYTVTSTGNTLAPAYTPASSSSLGGYAGAQTYPSTSMASTSGYNLAQPAAYTPASGTNTAPYMAPQSGAYASNAAATNPYASADPYASANPYGSTPPYASTAATSSGGLAPYPRSLPTSGQLSGSSDRYASMVDRFSQRNGTQYDGSVPSTNPSSAAASPYGYSPAATTSPYSPPAASGYAQPAASSYTQPAASYAPATSNPVTMANASSVTGQSAYPSEDYSRQSTSNPSYSVPAVGTSAPAATGYSPPATTYPSSTSSYPTGTSGYTPASSTAYPSSSSSYTLPTSNPNDPPPYLPGSTSQYRTQMPSSTSTSPYSIASPAGSAVTPADYSQPMGTLR